MIPFLASITLATAPFCAMEFARANGAKSTGVLYLAVLLAIVGALLVVDWLDTKR